MKKKFTLLTAAVMLLMFLAHPIGMMGQNREEIVAYTLDGTVTGGTSGYGAESEITQNDMTWMVTGNTTMNPWRIGGKNLEAVDRPLYSTSAMDDDITKVVVTNGTATATVNSMTLIVSSNADFSDGVSVSGDFVASGTTTFTKSAGQSWANKYFKLIYNITVSQNSNKYAQLISVDFYKENTGVQSVSTPTFNPAAGLYTTAQNVVISCATEGATLYYTLDGTDPTTSSSVYSSALAINETTTVKAMGVKNGMNNSNVATATYTIQQLTEINTVAGLWDFAETVGTTATMASVTFNDWYVTGVKNNQAWVSDGQYGFVIYQSGHGFNAGDKLNGTVACNVLLYQNHYAELTGVKAENLTVTSAQEVPVLTTTIPDLQVRNYGTAINLGTLTYNGSAFVDDNDNSIALYNQFSLSPNPITSLESGKQYNVKGVSIIYWPSAGGQTQQVSPRSADDFEEVVAPTLYTVSVAANIVNGTVTASPTSAEEGATITVTATPADGYELTELTYTYAGVAAPISILETKQFVMPAADVTVDATFTETVAQSLVFHKLVNHTDVTNDGTYMIVDVKGGYALTSANGTSAAPSAVAVTIVGDSISGEIDAALQWNFTSVDGGYKINPIDNDTLHLYSTSSNNGIRVGTNDNNVWQLDITDSDKPDYHGFMNVATIRYLGVYNNQDWRSYTSIHNNIKNTTIEIFVLGDAPTPTYYAVNVAEGIANGTVTVDPTSATEGETITVTATPADGYELTELTYTYAGVAAPISIMETKQFVMPAADVTVNATFTQTASVATPTFTPEEGTFITAQEVSIACATEGATIYYTTDGSTPSVSEELVYNGAITVTETTTLKAIAVKTGLTNSEVASATYTIVTPVTMAAARALELNEYALVEGVVTFIDGRNVYAQDNTAGIVLYLNNNTVPEALAVGDQVKAYGKKAVYKGLVELSGINGGDANQFAIVSNGNELPLAEKTIAEINADFAGDNLLQATRVKIVDAVIGTINTSGNTPITQDENSLNLYKMPVVDGLLENDIVTVTGVIGCYNAVQVRVASAEDVSFEHPVYPTLVVSTNTLEGLNYTVEEGPSQIKSFDLSANHLEGPAYVYPAENFEISSAAGIYFIPESCISISGASHFNNIHIYVRLKAGLALGDYEGVVTACSANANTVSVTVSGSVTEPQQSSDYLRIADLSQLTSGSKVVFAARFDSDPHSYYAMTAQASGKPTGVLFTSMDATNGETLPSSIADEEDTYYWTVETDGTNYLFTNAAGDALGYTSGTNFATGGDNTAWSIEYSVSDSAAMVPSYNGFIVTNTNNTGRAFALNTSHNYGAYSKSNMTGSNAASYNFFVDMFVVGGTGTMTCATPTFNPEGGTYYEEQSVSLSCNTPEATIYYTVDGSDPTTSSTVYTEPILVSANTTIKAFATKEGYEDSEIVEAEYVIVLGAVAIFNQNWEGDMNGWTFVTVEGSKPWTIAQYNNNHYAYGNGYNGGVNEQWCISPAFNLNNYGDVTLSFITAKNYSGPDLQLFFSNDYDGQDVTAATWTELSFEMSTGSFTWVESGDITFEGFAGDNCYIGFKYTSTETEAAAWEVDDILLMGLTSDPVLTATPTSLTGFAYTEGNGPSAEQSVLLSGMNLTETVTVSLDGDAFELSAGTGDDFEAVASIEISPASPAGGVEQSFYVRMAADLTADTYTGTVTISSQLDDITVSLTGVVNEPVQSGDWIRISSIGDLIDGGQAIIASRYDATVGDGYYAMTAGVSGKPEGVLFTSVIDNGVESLPDEIVNDATTFLWNVTVNDTLITLTNAAGDMLGYPTSGTNFSGNQNTDWSIVYGTAGDNTPVPGYNGFVVTNVSSPNRGIAKNASNNFGAYSTSNLNNADYNFYIDFFVLGGTATQTVATPVFSMASGTYYEEIDVEISCATEGASVYYTTDGSEPTASSTLYTGAIHVASDMTLKAIAMMEGYENSGIATANYVVITGLNIIFNQNWEGDMNGWTFVTVEGNKPWTVADHNGNHYANANGYGDDVDNEQWCISPAFNLTGFDEATLTFRNAKNYNGPDLQLFYADDYDGEDPTAASWQPLEFTLSTGSYAWTESGEISLTAFVGRSGHIGFRYTSNADEGAAAWEVDDLLLYGVLETSVGDEAALMDVTVWNSDSELFIENNTGDDLQLMVFDLLGRKVCAKAIATGSVRFSHNLTEGLYIVTLQNSKERVSSKMVVR